MFLKTLTIHNDDVLIREISFHKGINLIVDETTSGKRTATGNSVGKTTVLRLIDFCLAGKGKNIYLDSEFKNTNTTIESFLTENNITVTLTLIEDIEDISSKKIVVRRNFLSYSKKIQEINGDSYSNDDFSPKLKELIFKTTKKNPTFKQLKSKNIRDEKNKLVNTIRVLTPNVITDVTYEALHLFWFGIDVDSSKDKLVRDKNLEDRLQTRLRKESNLSQINQSLIIINKEITALENKKEVLSINTKYEEELSSLNNVKVEINKLSSKLSQLELRRELIIESKQDLEKDIAEINTNQIRLIYEKAKSLIPNIQKSFEETLSFHNNMIEQKVKFITEELPLLSEEIKEGKRTLTSLITKEKRLSSLLKKSDVIEELQTIINELNSFYEKKGYYEAQKSLWEKSNKKLNVINENLDRINKGINSKDKLIQEKIGQFNIFFSDISSRLDNVHSLLSADNSDGIYKFKIGNIEGNPGTGGKKSQMASFDLAYIQFADAHDIPCLHFVLQDQIENVHSNQITNLLTEIVDEVNCQYILPVLRDKLPETITIEQFEILSLSQNSKLFRV